MAHGRSPPQRRFKARFGNGFRRGLGSAFDDYRLSVAMGVYIAVEYCRGGINERWIHAWLPMLRRALTACDDLNCSELWL